MNDELTTFTTEPDALGLQELMRFLGEQTLDPANPAQWEPLFDRWRQSKKILERKLLSEFLFPLTQTPEWAAWAKEHGYA